MTWQTLFQNPAKGIAQLPHNVYVGLLQKTQHPRFFVYYASRSGRLLRFQGESREMGEVHAGLNPTCKVYEVISSISPKGWGPLLYDVAMEYATLLKSSLMADRERVSEKALQIWEHYSRRQGVRKLLLGGRCFHELNYEFLNYSYQKSPDTIEALKASEKLIFTEGETYPGSSGFSTAVQVRLP